MYIAELTYPGTWLDYEDDEWSWEIKNLIENIERPLTEACLALTLFEARRGRPRKGPPDPEEWEADAERRREIEIELATELGLDFFDPEAQQRLSSLARRELRREKWKSGELPEQYEDQLIFMYAKTYLYAAGRIEKLLGVIAEKEGVPETVVKAKAEFDAAFPYLRGVRNTVAHIEDRGRGLDYKGEELVLKPVQNWPIDAPSGGVLILESLKGNQFGCTMADGHYGEVEISIEKIAKITDCVQKTINAFKWSGPERHYPR